MTSSKFGSHQTHVRLLPSKFKLDLEPLVYERYWRFGLHPARIDYSFIQNLGTAQLQFFEFAQAKENYPIVFFESYGHIEAHAVLGLSPNINLAVNPQGKWRRDLYIPEMIDCYPFGTVEVEQKTYTKLEESLSVPSSHMQDGKHALLGIVPNNPMLVPIQDEPLAHQLFEQNGMTTPYVTQMLKRLGVYKDSQLETAAFISALKGNNLLKKRQLRLHFEGKILVLDGFSTISQTAYNQLSPSTLARWQTQGYTTLVEQHLESMRCWSNLMLLEERNINRALKELRRRKQE